MQKIPLALAAALTAGVSVTAHATNWFKLRGLNRPGQPTDSSSGALFSRNTTTPAIPSFPPALFRQKAVFNQIGPDLTSSSTFNIRRARVGARGANFPIDSKTNYFLLLEAGNNGITKLWRLGGGGDRCQCDAEPDPPRPRAYRRVQVSR